MPVTKIMLACALASAAVLAPASALAAPTQASTAFGWHRYKVPVSGQAELYDVVAPARDDAWAGGVRLNGGGPAGCDADGTTLMLHWNGTAWQRAKTPDLGSVENMTATGASDVWAVLECGLLHWNGTAWRSVKYPAPKTSPQATAGFPGDVTADAPGDAWLLGDVEGGSGQIIPFLDHWNGTAWSRATLPHVGGATQLSVVAAHGPSDVWIVGVKYASHRDTLVMLHWNGSAWTQESGPATGMVTIFVNGARMVSPGNLWVVGMGKATPKGVRHPLALHWNGHTWTDTPVPSGPGELYQAAAADSAVWAVGDTYGGSSPTYSADFLRWTGSRWAHAPIPVKGGDVSLDGGTARPGGGLWAVGGTGAAVPLIELWSRSPAS